MKSFFEEYGFVILAAIVVIILIAMATPIGDLVKTQIDGVINSFGSKTQSKLNATDGIIQVRVSTANNKITLEWEAVKKEDKFKYQYKASTISKDADWTPITEVSTGSDKSRKVEITTDSSGNALTNKTKVEYKIYDSNDQLVASGIVTAKVGKNATTGGEGGVGGGTPDISQNATGKTVSIEGIEFVILKQVEDSKYEVLAKCYEVNGSPIRFGSSDLIDYKNSNLVKTLNEDYYNSLPETIQNAIVAMPIQQKVFEYISMPGIEKPTWTGETKDLGVYKVFLPSYDEVITAAGGSSEETVKAFVMNAATDSIVSIFLRDIHRDPHDGTDLPTSIGITGDGRIHGSPKNFPGPARPAFVLDLSGIDYEIVK